MSASPEALAATAAFIKGGKFGRGALSAAFDAFAAPALARARAAETALAAGARTVPAAEELERLVRSAQTNKAHGTGFKHGPLPEPKPYQLPGRSA